ncbi:MAG: N-acetylmuramoyl-L-alanine amidase [Hyphomicrobiales bacterium]|nr:N-acetylmuramoyl-L-alanine amidase [Hyphomicrobiales bacterium]
MTTAAFDPDSALVSRVVPAANHEPRRLAGGPDMLVLHYTGMRDAERAIAWLATSASRVSCHYVIDEAGQVTQLVPEERRAWHAGESFWAGATDLNSASIGIEIHNPGHELDYREFPAVQVDAVIALSADICARRGIVPWRVLAHSDIAPRRKIDPGEKFPWQRLAERGVGHWVAPSPVRAGQVALGLGEESAGVAAVQELFAGYGYETRRDGVFDDGFEKVVRAFQRHFRPALCDGRLDLSTLSTLERLIAALPAGAVSA